MARPAIQITIIGQLGKRGCHRGHKVGDTFDFDSERGNLCPMAMHVAFPYIDILRYGGSIPGQPDGTAVFCCPDVDTIQVFKIEVKKKENSKMEGIMKNINKAEVVKLKNEVNYQDGQVVSKTLVQNTAVSVTLFAFDKDEEISTHESGGDAFVTCLDGVGRITIDDAEYELREGESIVMPAKHPHAVYGKEQFKMLLVVVF